MSYYGGNYNGGVNFLPNVPSTFVGSDTNAVLKNVSAFLLIVYILVRFGMTAVREGPKSLYSSVEMWAGPALLVVLLTGYADMNGHLFLSLVLLYAVWMVLVSWFV